MQRAALHTQPDPAAVLAKATARASELLGLTGVALARTIGLSEPTVSRILRGEKTIAPTSKEGELALLLVRVYRSLDALVGTDDARRRAWMDTYNRPNWKNHHGHHQSTTPRRILPRRRRNHRPRWHQHRPSPA